MKVGLLTYHRVVNDGSAMQAWCLMDLLREWMPTAQVELIDYRSREWERRERRKVVPFPKCKINVAQWMKRRGIHRFIRNHGTLSARSCTTDDVHIARQFVRDQQYDSIVVGSDTVWEYRPEGAAPLWPNIYFLPDIRHVRKCACAVSMDRTDPEVLQAANLRSWLVDQVSTFDFVSVRDEMTRDCLVAAGVESDRLCRMADPTMMGHLEARMEPLPQHAFPAGKVAGIGVGDPTIRRRWSDFLSQQGYVVVNLLGASVEGQKLLPSRLTPGQRLTVYSKLALLVTDRFHGTIFGLQLGRAPVIFVEREQAYPDMASKGRDLLRSLGLECMVLREEAMHPRHQAMDRLTSLWQEHAGELPARLEEQRRASLEVFGQLIKRLEGR